MGSGGTSVSELYQYSYIPFGLPNAGLVSSVVLSREVGGGPAVTVRQVAYTYYVTGDPYGNTGDLETATVEDANGNALDTTYYRYYTSDGPTGYADGLEYVFGPDAYGRLTAALGTSLDSLTNAQVAPYADNYFQYDSSHRVTEEIAAGAGSSDGSSPGLGTFTYGYTASSNTPGLNSWAMKTVETLPDGNSNMVYTNAAGEVMLSDHHDATTGQDWDTFDEYDSLGHVILDGRPVGGHGYNDSYADLLDNTGSGYYYLSSSTGLITLYDYATTTTATSTTPGDAADYLKDTKVEQGQTGTADPAQQRAILQPNGAGARRSTRWRRRPSTATPTAPAARRPATRTPGARATCRSRRRSVRRWSPRARTAPAAPT